MSIKITYELHGAGFRSLKFQSSADIPTSGAPTKVTISYTYQATPYTNIVYSTVGTNYALDQLKYGIYPDPSFTYENVVITVGSNTYSFGNYTVTTANEDKVGITYVANAGNIACFTETCELLTPSGYKSVSTINTGDMIVTHDGRTVPVTMFKTRITTNEYTAPYRIPKHTFGHNIPKLDIELSPSHALQIRKGVWQKPKIAAETYNIIKQFGIGKEITYYHAETPNYFRDHLVCNGTIVESFSNKQLDGMKMRVYKFNRALNGFTRLASHQMKKE